MIEKVFHECCEVEFGKLVQVPVFFEALEQKQLIHQSRQTADFLEDAVEGLSGSIVDASQEEFQVSPDRCEGGSDLVGCIGRELAHAHHFSANALEKGIEDAREVVDFVVPAGLWKSSFGQASQAFGLLRQSA